MALNLDLTYAQSNDAVTLTVTDSTGTYDDPDNLTGWETGAATNEDVADIIVASATTAAKHHLTLIVTVTDKDGTETTYDEIDLFAHDSTGPFTVATDLTWDFNAADFVSGGTAMGAATDKLDDGIYAITYNLVDAPTDLTSVDSVIESTIVDGDVRISVYDKLRQVPTDYDCEDNDRSRDIMEALLAYCYLQSIEASASVSNTSELVTQLYTLDKMVSDGSHYTW